MTRPILYVCGPYLTATETEKATRLDAVRAAAARGWTPIFAPFLFERAYHEETEAVRALAREMNEALLAAADALLVVGERRTEGMLAELAWWGRCVAPVYQWPDLPKAEDK